MVGEFVDTVLFCTIAFGPLGVWLGGGSIPLPALLNYIAVGFVCAFLAALVVVRWLLNYVSVHGYAVFAWWRIVVGSLAALALLAGW